MVLETVAASAQHPARAQHPPQADQPVADAPPLLRRVRRDALPEEICYRDDGCDVHPRCLTCPLPRCRYDEPGGVRAMLNAYRDQQIAALRSDGAPVDLIAERYSLSRRTVFRILSSASGGLKTGLEKAATTGDNGSQPLSQPERGAMTSPHRRVALAARDAPSRPERPDMHPGFRRQRRERRDA